MVASKLTITPRRPESVRGRGHLRWLGALPVRVQVNAPERLSHVSVQTAWFHAPAGRHGPGRRQRTLRARSPSARRGRPRRGCRPGLTALPPPKRPRIVLEPSSNRPRTFPEGPGQLPGRIPEGSRKDPAWVRRQRDAAVWAVGGAPSGRPPTARRGALAGGADVVFRRDRRPDALESPRKDPASFPEGSGQRPRRIRPASPTACPTPPPSGGGSCDRRPVNQRQSLLARRSAAPRPNPGVNVRFPAQRGANSRPNRRTRGAPAGAPHPPRPPSRSQRSQGGWRRARAGGEKKISGRLPPNPAARPRAASPVGPRLSRFDHKG